MNKSQHKLQQSKSGKYIYFTGTSKLTD